MSDYLEPILSKYQYGFREAYSAQNCFLVIVKKWKRCLDKKRTCGTLLPRKLLLAELKVYGFD